LLIERARARTHYPREWGEVVEYDADLEEGPAADGPGGEEKLEGNAADPQDAQESPEGRKVVIIPEDFDKPAAVYAGEGEGGAQAGGKSSSIGSSANSGAEEAAQQVRAPSAKSLRA
jgi:hypothetical protein